MDDRLLGPDSVDDLNEQLQCVSHCMATLRPAKISFPSVLMLSVPMRRCSPPHPWQDVVMISLKEDTRSRAQHVPHSWLTQE